MKILFVNADGFYYNNSSTMQNMGIVYGLKKINAEVDLLALEPQNGTVGFDPNIQKVLEECIAHVYLIPLNCLYRSLNKGKKHVVENTGHENKKISYLKGTIRKFIKNLLVFDLRILNLHNVDKVKIDLDQYDMIISASDPKSTHCMTNRLVKEHHYSGRYIQYWGDPLYLDITRDKGVLDGICKAMEMKTLRTASKIIYATPFTLRDQQKLYPEMASKMGYAHQAGLPVINWTDEKKSSQKEKIRLVYCGDYRKETRNIMPLYQAVCQLGKSYKLDIYGTSNFHLASTDNVIVHGQVSRKKADNAEQKADVLVCICNVQGSQIPGKIYYLTNYNKPIIVIVDGEYKEELKKYFNEMKRFIICENREADINEAIKRAQEARYNREFQSTQEFSPVFMVKNILSKNDEEEH